jgi:hypothetical protein
VAEGFLAAICTSAPDDRAVCHTTKVNAARKRIQIRSGWISDQKPNSARQRMARTVNAWVKSGTDPARITDVLMFRLYPAKFITIMAAPVNHGG